ncbi:MAG: histidinol-phosphate transaminase [Acidobacteria bacterium]|nr:MAG: histidinol-phosphate transaminase [Acidobacteriota bacterium]
MSDPLRHVKPAVRAVKAYTLAARRARVKINQNENPFELPDAVKRRVLDRARARPWGRYPEFDPRELTAALAAFAGWRPDGVLAGNGSNELIEALLLVTVGAGTRVVIPEPTFTLYALLTSILGGQAVRVPLGPDLEYDAEAIARARRGSEAAVTVVCSPNNPTGGILARDAIARLCAEGDGLVVIDEAYHEFAGETVVPLLAEHANLVVLRTFSKAMALAGLRVGYLLAHPDLVREIDKARLPYNVNFFSQMAALAALEERGTLDSQVAHLVRLREALMAELRVVPGVRAYPSRANFILVELERADPRAVFESLYAAGILVRDVSAYPRLGRCLRVSVGTEEENAALIDALRRALAGERQPRAAAGAREGT